MPTPRAIAAAVPARRKAAPAAAAVARPALAAAGPLQTPPLLQRRCACGGSCPRCNNDDALLQPRLKLGAADDIYEREADRIASRLVAQGPPPVNATPEPAADRETAVAPLDAARLQRGGEPLAPALRAYFEPRLGRDLSAVRVHGGAESGAFNQQLNSYAFTYGSHVWLGAGQQPAADFVLAHELAHVVQQGGAKPLAPGSGGAAGTAMPAQASEPAVRRLGGTVGRFWVPLGAAGPLGGSKIHEMVLGNAVGSDIDVEAPAANADRKQWGLGRKGSIDMYRGKRDGTAHVMTGLYFTGVADAQGADVETTTAKSHRKPGGKVKSATFAPSVSKGGRVEDINLGPHEVELGELKPADQSSLDAGKTQLKNYIDGMQEAARLTNALGAKRKPAENWKLKEPKLLSDTAVKFEKGGKDMKFDPANPRNDTALAIGVIEESRSDNTKYEVRIEYNPADHGLPQVTGGFYAQAFTPGSGLWMYFGRPFDLNAAKALAHKGLKNPKQAKNVAGNMETANKVHEQVLDALLSGPQVKRLRRPLPAPAATGTATPAAPDARQHSEAATLRRKAKPKPSPKLEDSFVLKTWQTNVKTLRGEIVGPHTTNPTQRERMGALEFLEHAYAAEEQRTKLSQTGPSLLPDKKSELVEIISGKQPAGPKGAGKSTSPKTHTRSLGDLFSWLKGWTSLPVEKVLGNFRARFGTSFVFVAEKVAKLRDTVKAKLDAALKRKGKSSPGGKARILIKAIGKALLQIGEVLLHRTVTVLVDTIERGIDKKLDKLLDIEPVKLLEEKFGEEFEKFTAPLETLKTKAEEKIDAAAAEYAGDLAWIEDVKALSAKIGPIVEVASIALQCASPPGWGCLKLLARQLTDCAIDAALNICWVQKKVAGVVENFDKVNKLPNDIAALALKHLKALAPKGLEDIFSEPVAAPTESGKGEIDCADSPPDPDCAAFAGSGGSGTPSDLADNPVYDEMAKMKGECSGEQIDGMAQMAEAAGMPPDRPLTAEQLKKMRELMQQAKGLSGKDFADMANGNAPPDVKDKLQPLQDYLDKEASDAIKDQMLRDFKDGKFSQKHDEMAREKQRWRILKPYKLGNFKNYPVLVHENGNVAVGVADGSMGLCYEDGKFPADIVRADIVDIDGKAVPISTPFHVADAQIDNKVCPGTGSAANAGAGAQDSSASEPEPEAEPKSAGSTPPPSQPDSGAAKPLPGGKGSGGNTGGSKKGGGGKGSGRKPAQLPRSDTWLIYGEYKKGDFSNRSVHVYQISSHRHGQGKIDGTFIQCYGDGKVSVVIKSADVSSGGDPLSVKTPVHVVDAQLAEASCPAGSSSAVPRKDKPSGGTASKVCLDGTQCAGGSLQIAFDEYPSADPDMGWVVWPHKSEPDKTPSLLRSDDNPGGVFEAVSTGGSNYDIYRVDGAERKEVGKATKKGPYYEVTAGALLDDLQTALKQYLVGRERSGSDSRSSRVHLR